MGTKTNYKLSGTGKSIRDNDSDLPNMGKLIKFISIETNRKYFSGRLAANINFLKNPNDLTRIKSKYILVADQSDWEKHTHVLENINHYCQGLLLKIEPETYPLFYQMIESEVNISLLRKIRPIQDNTVLNRVMHAWKINAQDDLIADVKINKDGQFYILGCNLQIFSGNLKLLKLKNLKSFSNFTVDDHGSFIYFPEVDIHLDLPAIRMSVDPDFRKKSIRAGVQRQKNLGRQMKNFREKRGVRQTDFDISDRQIQRFESGKTYPTFSALEKIARVFGISVEDYVAELKKPV